MLLKWQGLFYFIFLRNLSTERSFNIQNRIKNNVEVDVEICICVQKAIFLTIMFKINN